jgi:ABC-2 type transport system ATP-binding protein
VAQTAAPKVRDLRLMDMPDAIRIDGLTKYFGPVVGLEGLSLNVSEGEVFGFLGPNGSGKTTTIRLLLDLLRPTSGDAWMCGYHCRTQGREARNRVGYLPGELPMYPELTGARFLRFLQSVGKQPVGARWLEQLLRRFDVSEVDLGRRMRDYSHGMKRKLGIIQALAPRPPLLILDEPTNGLDPLMIEAFAQTLDDLKREGRTTIFLSSHVLSEVEKTCDRVGLIRRGALAVVESLATLRARMPRTVRVSYASRVTAPVPSVDGVHAVSISERLWVFEVHGPLGGLIAALAGLPIDDIRVEPFTLEDYVLKFYVSGAA